MTTQAQKTLFGEIELVETQGGWMVKHGDDEEDLLAEIEMGKVYEEDFPVDMDCSATHYTFSDGSKIIESRNDNGDKIFNHY